MSDTNNQLIEFDDADILEVSLDLSEASWEFINESSDNESGLVDGQFIIARVSGPFFGIDTKSNNGRFYERALWDKVIASINEKLSNRELLGTIGHEGELDDLALRRGEASHFLTKLWIDETKKVGMGEILVMSTTAGLNLNTLLRSKVKLAVSSRAKGRLLKRTIQGLPVVDPDAYMFKGFDFVRTPGIPIAYPSLVESHTENTSDPTIDEKGKTVENTNNMELVESLSADKARLQIRLDEAVLSATTLQSQLSAVSQTLDAKVQELGESQKTIETLLAKTKDIDESLVALKEFQVLGTATGISEELLANKEVIAKYQDLGSVEEIGEALTLSKSTIEKYAAFGSPEEIGEALAKAHDMLETYAALGTPEAIRTVLDNIAENYITLGHPSQVRKCFNVLESVLAIGTPAKLQEMKEALDSYEKLGGFEVLESLVNEKKNIEESAKAKKIQDFATANKVTVRLAESLLASHSEEEAVSMITEMHESSTIASRFRADPNKQTTDVNENKTQGPIKGLASRLMNLNS